MNPTLIAIFVGYVSGSIPYGLMLARLAGLGDIRQIGSGNIGATNVLRTGNKTIAALTLLADVFKGFLPVAFGFWLGGEWPPVLAGLAAMAGHILPIWLRFKGGKGVATAAGVLFGWSWPVAVLALAAWAGMFAFQRISSLSALTAAVVAVAASLWFTPQLFWAFLLLGVVVFITHRSNIKRLLAGTEPKSTFTKSK